MLHHCREMGRQSVPPCHTAAKKHQQGTRPVGREYTYRCILTNDYTSTDRDIVEYYNKRGGAERVLDDMNNGFGWKRLPKSFMAENTVFLLLTALIRNFYRHLISDANMKSFGLKRTSRIKTLYSSMFLSLQNGLRLQDSTY